MQGQQPDCSLDEVFELYCQIFKPLYHEIEAENEVPNEVFFEILAVLDHLSRMSSYGHSETSSSDRARGHLKRACFDLFKLKVKKVIELYKQFQKIDLSLIDNGRFEGELIALVSRIKTGAAEARGKEGRDPREVSPDDLNAFDLWMNVHDLCVQVEKGFFSSEKIDWARRKSAEVNHQVSRAINRKSWWISFSAGFVSGLCAAGLIAGLRWFLS